MMLEIKLEKLEAKNQLLSNYIAAPKEFHISRNARDKYQFDESLFSLSGNVIFANFRASRKSAQ